MFKLFNNSKETINLKCPVTSKAIVYFFKSQNTVLRFLKIDTLKPL